MNPVFSGAELRGIMDSVLRNVPKEKAKGVLERAKIARVLQSAGSVKRDGVGQRVGVVDARTFYRWHQENPGMWDNKAERDKFLRDNPQCRAEGYNPTSRKIVLNSTKYA